MAAKDKPTRRLFQSLRRGPRGSGLTSERSAAEESAMWAAHQRAVAAARDSGESAQRIASHVAKQRSTVDSLADRARAVAARAHDVSASFGRVTDAFARLELVALNAALEGARFGEGIGQALAHVSEEVKAQASRGAEASRDLSTALGEIGGELLQVHGGLDRAREVAAEVANEAARVAGASAEAERVLAEIGARLQRTTGSDPETSRAIADAAEHARALVAALGTLSGKVPRSILVAALRPVLEPLSRLLEGEDEG